MKKDSKMKRILARLLVVALVLQMGLPLNVMAAPSELQETETETEAPLREDDSESEEVSEEATEEVATEEISEESTEENTEEVLAPISSEEEMDDLRATGEDCTDIRVLDGGFKVGTDPEGRCKLLWYGGEETEVVVPAPIEVIGEWSFSGDEITKITFSESVKYMESKSIYRMNGLKSIDFGHVEEMEDSPLDGCLYLEEVILPRNNFTVERLQSYGGFASQVTMYIPKEVTELPEAFGIEQSRLSIKEYVVEGGNPSYESIDGVLFTKPQNGERTLIGYPMYKDAESYVIPEDVTTIGDSAFWFCCEKSPLKELTISKNVKTVETLAFSYTKLDRLILLANIETVEEPESKYDPTHFVGDYTWKCGIGEIVFGDDAFKMSEENIVKLLGNANIKKLTLPADFQGNISGKVLATYSALEEVNIAEENEVYKTVDGMVLSKDGAILYAMPASNSNSKEIIIPESVTTIKTDAFYAPSGKREYSVSKVNIPSGVNSIEANAFTPNGSLEISAVFEGAADVFEADAIANGGEGVTLYCMPEEADEFEVKFPACNVIPVGMEFEVPEETSQTEIVLSGKADPNSVVKVYVDDVYATEVVTDDAGEWQTFVKVAVSAADDKWKIHVTNEDGTIFSESKYVKWDGSPFFSIPDEVNTDSFLVYGTGIRYGTIYVYVDGKLAGKTEADWNGKFGVRIPLEDPVSEKQYEVYVVSERDGYKGQSEVKTFLYKDCGIKLDSVTMQWSEWGKSEPYEMDITNPFEDNRRISFDPNVPIRYTVNLTESDMLDKVLVKVASKADATKRTLNTVKIEDGTWEAECAGNMIVPNYVEIVCVLKSGETLTIYASEIFMLIDPSGYIYEVALENRVEGATAAIYYKEKLSDEEKTLWDAENYGQVNPQVTGANGYYGWDVPVGYWQVVVNKEGYQTAQSEWMSVPPIRTDVNLELISTESAVIKAAYLSGNQVKVNFSHYMKADMVTAEVFKAEGLGDVVSVTPYNAIDYKGTKVALEFIIEFKSKAKSGETYKLVTDASEMETYAGVKGFADDASKEIEMIAAAALFKEVVIPKNVAVQVGTEKTVTLYVKGDGEDLSGYTFNLNGELMKEGPSLSIVTDKNGAATFVVVADEPGTSWIDVAIGETEATIRVDVVRSSEVADELGAIELNDKAFKFTLEKDEYIYTGAAIEPVVTVEDLNKKVLVKDVDYTVTYTDNVDAGENANVVINGIGAYKGTVKVPFTILAVELKKENIKLSKNAYKLSEYTNEELAQGLLPAVEVKVGELLLTEGKDYVVTAENNKQPGKAKAVVKGINNYAKEVACEYTIEGVNLAKVKFNKIPTQSILDAPIEIIPTVDAKYLEKTGAKEIKFNMAFDKNDKPGTATIYLYGGDGMNTTGKRKLTFKIEKVKFTTDNLIVGTALDENGNVIPGIAPQDYTGEALKPEVYVGVKTGGRIITLGEEDYSIKYSNNAKAGKLDKEGNPVASAKVTVKGKGNFAGSVARTFVINPIEIGNGETLSNDIAMDVLNIIKYTGKNVKPAPKLYYTANDKKVALKAGKDYKITCEQKGEKDKTVKVEYTINGIGNFKGSAKAFVWVSDEKVSVKLSTKSVVYTGKEITLAADEIKVFRGKTEVDKAHYSVTYLNNVNAGTATVIVKGDEKNFVGEAVAAFKITPKVLAEAEDGIHVNLAESKVFTGYPVELGEEEVEVYDSKAEKELIQTKDFTLKYSSNTKIGTAKVTLSGKGNYKGKIQKTFKISKLKDFAQAKIMTEVTSCTFNGKAQKPKLMVYYNENGALVELNVSKVFTVTYKENKEPGMGIAILKPKKGIFETVTDETIEVKFLIEKAGIEDAKANVIKVQPYKGKAVTPKVSLKLGSYKLKEGVDYTVEYENNDSRGRATIIIKAIEKNGEKEGNFTGEKRIDFFIF